VSEDRLECACRRADVRDTRVAALNHRFLDYRVAGGRAGRDAETREEDERVREQNERERRTRGWRERKRKMGSRRDRELI